MFPALQIIIELSAISVVCMFHVLYVIFVLFDAMQNPRQADAMTKVQAELDETKIVLVSAIKINKLRRVECNG